MGRVVMSRLLVCVGLIGCATSAGRGTGGSGGAGGNAASGGTFAGASGTGGFGGTFAGSGGFGGTFAGSGAGNGGFGVDGGPGCDNDLVVTVRDFTEAHPDFESFVWPQVDGIVQRDLGSDNKPVYAHPGPTACTTGPTEFAQWYNDTPGINIRVPVNIQFTETSPGVFVYDNSEFFPIDGMGFGNGPDMSIGTDTPPPPHNYLFTTEMHTLFTYQGGEVFTFRGDDDLWIFINKKLAIDIGGVHGPETETLNMDARASELGLSIGQTYAMDIFHAERHTTGSNFRIETTIDFSCVINIPPVD